MTNHSSTLAWKIPRTEEPGRLQSMGSQRVGHNWVTSLHIRLYDSVEDDYMITLRLSEILQNSFLIIALYALLGITASVLKGGLKYFSFGWGWVCKEISGGCLSVFLIICSPIWLEMPAPPQKDLAARWLDTGPRGRMRLKGSVLPLLGPLLISFVQVKSVFINALDFSAITINSWVFSPCIFECKWRKKPPEKNLSSLNFNLYVCILSFRKYYDFMEHIIQLIQCKSQPFEVFLYFGWKNCYWNQYSIFTKFWQLEFFNVDILRQLVNCWLKI